MIIATKKGRCVILTTSLLDEAEVLSNRIGILKNGKLIACGSAPFLKEHLGDNYYEPIANSVETTPEEELPSSDSKKQNELGQDKGEVDDKTNDKDLEDILEHIWRKRHRLLQDLSIFWKKLYILQHIIMSNAWKSRLIVSTNIVAVSLFLFGFVVFTFCR